MFKVTENDLKSFEDQGFMVINGVLDPEKDIKSVEEEYSVVLDSIIDELIDGKERYSSYRELPFLERYSEMICAEIISARELDITLPPNFTEDTPIHLGPAVFHHVLRNQGILDIIETLIGPEIYCNAIQHTRIKPPQRIIPEAMQQSNIIASTLWHQDIGVIEPAGDDSELISVWIAMTDVNEDNGCLVLIPGSHKQHLVQHCFKREPDGVFRAYRIPDEKLDDGELTPMVMKAGDALFFHKSMMHSAHPNRSDTVRWSFDLRYNPIGENDGRSWLPGFVARSSANPESVLTDAEVWAQNWREARTRLLKNGDSKRPHNRWHPDDPGCA